MGMFDDLTTPKSGGGMFDDLLPAKKKSTVAQGIGNLGAGLVRGAGSIGATLLAPIDIAKDAIDGKGLSLESNRQRRADIDAGLQSLGADTDSLLYKGGKLTGEVAGTAGVGGLLANGLRTVPGIAAAAPRLLSSLETGGFVTGAPAGTGLLGRAADMGIRAVGGGVTGAATAGLANPSDAGVGGVLGAALPGALKVSGLLGEKAASGAEAASRRLMQSAVKPTIGQLKTGEAATAVQMLLDYGISPTQAGVGKLRSLIDDLNGQIASQIGSSNATINKQAVANRLSDVEKKFMTQVSPSGDLKAIRSVADDFMAHPLYTGNDIPIQGAQELKQGTYKTLSKKYGEVGSAETEAQKALARGLKEEISSVLPDVAKLNAEESRLLATLNVAERRALMELNKNPVGLGALASSPAGWAAFMADRSAAFKSLAARMLNSSVQKTRPTGSLMIDRMSDNPLLRNAAVISAGGE